METDIAAPVVAWLREEGWTVYQEVPLRGGSCDIVATRGSILWAIECKEHLNADVCEQAERWLRHSNLTSVAVAKPKHTTTSRVLGAYLSDRGIGLFDVFDCSIREQVAPALRRRRDSKLEKALMPEQQTYVKAGSPGGRRYTPFKDTCARLARYVQAHPGCFLKQALDSEGFTTHYSSKSAARSSLHHWLNKDMVEGVAIKRTSLGRITLWPFEKEAAA
jgi:hypothetical protein